MHKAPTFRGFVVNDCFKLPVPIDFTLGQTKSCQIKNEGGCNTDGKYPN